MIPNFFHMQAKVQEEETRTIVDPDYPDQPMTITLHQLDVPEKHFVSDLVDQLTELYLGYPEQNIAPKTKLGKVRDKSGKRVSVKLSNALFWSVARIITQQVVPAGGQIATPESLLYASKTWSGGWDQLVIFSAEIENKGKTKANLKPGEDEEEDPGKGSEENTAV